MTAGVLYTQLSAAYIPYLHTRKALAAACFLKLCEAKLRLRFGTSLFSSLICLSPLF